jgi:transcriptional antiterminator NusG
MDWYAVFVETGREHDAKRSISRLVSSPAVECLVLRRRITERRQGRLKETLRPLFPGYLLIKGNMDMSLYRTIMSAPGVLKVLAAEGSYWTRIPDDEMEPILQLLHHGDILDYSQVTLPGTEVVVLSGPLYGLEHLIRKIDKRKGRARVSLVFHGTEHTVDLGVSVVPPAPPDAPYAQTGDPHPAKPGLC